MVGGSRWKHGLLGVGLVAALEGCAAIALMLALPQAPAQAQYYGNRYQQRPPPSSGGFFGGWFGGGSPRWGGEAPWHRQQQQQAAPQREREREVDYSHAPVNKEHKNDEAASTFIAVMGDGMADWLAYGLEDAFSDAPEVAITRNVKSLSGLLRYEYKSDLDWWHVARDTLAKEKANYVVIMLGLSDRQSISEKDVAKEEEKEQDEKKTDQSAQDKDKKSDDAVQDAKAKPARGTAAFRSDRWAEIYSHRVDQMIAAAKSKGVPVFWVGLPSIRGARSTADAVYLNDLYRARAEKAGINYIDIWDGFVDESGKYTNYGPDYEGQTRRLRTPDGVFFTNYGARKLAHYVEREIRRYMNNRATPVALPVAPAAPTPGGKKSAERPLSGPVLPLSVATGNSDVLAGGGNARPTHGDALATQVLVKGDAVRPPAGRADDFSWTGNDGKPAVPAASAPLAAQSALPGNAVANAAPSAPAPASPAAAAPPVIAKPQPAQPPAPPAKPQAKLPAAPPPRALKPVEHKPIEPKPIDPKPADQAQSKPTPPGLIPPAPVGAQRNQHPQRRSQSTFDNLFGWMR